VVVVGSSGESECWMVVTMVVVVVVVMVGGVVVVVVGVSVGCEMVCGGCLASFLR